MAQWRSMAVTGMLACSDSGPNIASPSDAHYFNSWPLLPLQKFLDCFTLGDSSAQPTPQPLHTEQFTQANEGSMDSSKAASDARQAVAQLAATGGALLSRLATHTSTDDPGIASNTTGEHIPSGSFSIGGITSSLRTAASSWLGGVSGDAQSVQEQPEEFRQRGDVEQGILGALENADAGAVSHDQRRLHDLGAASTTVLRTSQLGSTVTVSKGLGETGDETSQETEDAQGIQRSEDTAQAGVDSGAGSGNTGAVALQVLVDSTFDYWTNAAAAPRIQAMIPQARFVVILQV